MEKITLAISVALLGLAIVAMLIIEYKTKSERVVRCYIANVTDYEIENHFDLDDEGIPAMETIYEGFILDEKKTYSVATDLRIEENDLIEVLIIERIFGLYKNATVIKIIHQQK